MIGDCAEKELSPIVSLLHLPGFIFDTGLFINPKLGLVNIALDCCGTQLPLITTSLAGVLHTDLAGANDHVDWHNGVANLSGDPLWKPFIAPPVLPLDPWVPVIDTDTPSQNCLAQHRSISGFLSGTTQTMPIGDFNSYILDSIPNHALLTSLSFPGLLALASAGKVIQGLLCNTNPLNPCGIITTIFGIILGQDDLNLGNICAKISDITLIADVIAILDALMQSIINTIQGMLDALLYGVHLGLAKLLKVKDPCMQQIINKIAGEELNNVGVGVGIG